ncbi:hypothetical protein NDU88_005810 [Pleurodeles waltl]|uniref:Uncharacterized protein n=1 Tax=Pleurodeles waltl TaxID=8319 RepID=A0AAV7VMS2_PLEWA|nr:hypothetical protein NDU88_005810 [Pleurodeles waltl]
MPRFSTGGRIRISPSEIMQLGGAPRESNARRASRAAPTLRRSSSLPTCLCLGWKPVATCVNTETSRTPVVVEAYNEGSSGGLDCSAYDATTVYSRGNRVRPHSRLPCRPGRRGGQRPTTGRADMGSVSSNPTLGLDPDTALDCRQVYA